MFTLQPGWHLPYGTLMCILLLAGGTGGRRATAGDQAPAPRRPLPRQPAAKPLGEKPAPPPDARRLAPNVDVWLDAKRKAVVVDGLVCMRKGPLEMFACTRGTKEYESIVVVNTKAYVVHAALLALGAEPGAPARFRPTYAPARGTEIGIKLFWTGADGKRHQARAQDWIRNARNNKAMIHHWVFAGSGFWTDPRTGRRYYQAEGGDFICVSNFPDAMLDLPIKSTQANEDLLFEAFTERIPPLGTPVRMLLLPKLDGKKAASVRAKARSSQRPRPVRPETGDAGGACAGAPTQRPPSAHSAMVQDVPCRSHVTRVKWAEFGVAGTGLVKTHLVDDFF